MAKNQKAVAPQASTTTPVVTAEQAKAQLKAMADQRKALREIVKANAESLKAESKEKQKEVTLRWIGNFTARIKRLESKISKAAIERQKLIARAKENGWLQ